MKSLLFFLLLLPACPLPAQVDKQEELMRSLLDTFIGAGDMDSAIETAAKAEKLYPKDPFWLKKRAELSLWKSDPRSALDAFRKLLSLENTRELRRRVTALAIGLKDFPTALYALELDLAANDLERADDLIYIYEQLGQPEKAARLIEKYSARFNSPSGYSKAIELLTNMGERREAERAYNEAIAKFGLTTSLAHGYAELLASRKELGRALELLKKAEPRAKPSDTGFWNVLGDLAWYFGDVETAVKAARTLDAAGMAREPEYDRLTAYYRTAGREKEAEETYGKAWARTSKPYFLLAGLALIAARNDYQALEEAVSALTPEQENAVGKAPYYWTLKALAESAAGRQLGALAAYETLLSLSPDSEEAKTQLLWFLSASGLDARLRERIGPLSAGGAEMPEKQLALAYAYLSIDDPQAALSRLAAYAALRPGGADREIRAEAVAAAGRQDEAQDLLFGKWLALAAARNSGTMSAAEGEAWLRLCARFCAAPRFASELALLGSALPPEAVINARLARASLAGETEAVSRLGRMLRARPAWLRLSEAMEAWDVAGLSSLLREDFHSLPFRDRIAALERAGLPDEASGETARLLWDNGNDLLLNLKAAELLDPRRTAWRTESSYRERKALESAALSVEITAPKAGYSILSAGGNVTRRTPRDGTLLLTNREDREAWASVGYYGVRWDASIKAGARDSARKFFSASARLARRFGDGTSAELSAACGARAEESSYLEAAGLKDRAAAAISGPLARPYYYRLSAESSQLFSQDRVYSGRSGSFQAELSRLDRLPGWSLSTRAYWQNYSSREAPGAKGSLDEATPFAGARFVPVSSNQYGGGFTLARAGRALPMRRLSPYLSGDYYYNTSFLGGISSRAGASFSPWRRDITDFWLEYAKGYQGAGEEVKSAGLSLTVYF